jgi:phosphoribosylamine--glycine ligase
VVAAAEGYPGDYKKGLPVSGLDDLDTPVFIAGAETADGGDIYTTGGRVLTVTGMGPDLAAAQEAAYLAAASISFPGMYLRRDIGGRLPAS